MYGGSRFKVHGAGQQKSAALGAPPTHAESGAGESAPRPACGPLPLSLRPAPSLLAARSLSPRGPLPLSSRAEASARWGGSRRLAQTPEARPPSRWGGEEPHPGRGEEPHPGRGEEPHPGRRGRRPPLVVARAHPWSWREPTLTSLEGVRRQRRERVDSGGRRLVPSTVEASEVPPWVGLSTAGAAGAAP